MKIKKKKKKKFIKGEPKKIIKLDNERLKVQYGYLNDNKEEVTCEEEFDTVLFATGRIPETKKLNLDKIGVKLDKLGKIIVNEYESSSVPNIYAIGDVISGGLELTPVAIAAGKLLAERLYNKESKGKKMDYLNISTTIFTPIEYGCCGYSEEGAIQKFGEENIKIYKKNVNILEHEIPHFHNPDTLLQAFCKLVCLGDEEQVIGFHFVGPHAGEVTQLSSVVIKLKATKEDFDSTIGIHPTLLKTLLN